MIPISVDLAKVKHSVSNCKVLVIANYAGCNVHLVSGIYVSHAGDINTEEGVVYV